MIETEGSSIQILSHTVVATQFHSCMGCIYISVHIFSIKPPQPSNNILLLLNETTNTYEEDAQFLIKTPD